MSYEHRDEPAFERVDADPALLTTPRQERSGRVGRLSEDERGVALSVLWWVEAPAAEDGAI